jgi:hypothetical protein
MTAAAADATDDADRPAAVEGEAVPDEPSPADEVLSSLMSEDEPAPGAPATTRSGAQAPRNGARGIPTGLIRATSTWARST